MPVVYEVICDGESNFYSNKRQAMEVARDFASGGDIVRVYKLHIPRLTIATLLRCLNHTGYVTSREEIAHFSY